MRADCFFVDPTYKQCWNEETYYDAITHWVIIASCPNSYGGLTYFEFSNTFETQEDALNGIKSLSLFDDITLDQWREIGQDNKTLEDLEYEWDQLAFRERNGLPL